MFVKKPTFGQILKALPNLFNGKLTDLPFIYPIVGKEIEVGYRKHLMIEADGILEHFVAPCKVTCIEKAVVFRS